MEPHAAFLLMLHDSNGGELSVVAATPEASKQSARAKKGALWNSASKNQLSMEAFQVLREATPILRRYIPLHTFTYRFRCYARRLRSCARRTAPTRRRGPSSLSRWSPSKHPCDHPVTSMSPPCDDHATTMRRPCNRHAATMQPPCSHHATNHATNHATTIIPPSHQPCHHHAPRSLESCNGM